jgi:hypothetical protein
MKRPLKKLLRRTEQALMGKPTFIGIDWGKGASRSSAMVHSFGFMYSYPLVHRAIVVHSEFPITSLTKDICCSFKKLASVFK